MRPLLILCLLAVSFLAQNSHGFWTNSATTAASKPGYISHRTPLRPGFGLLPRRRPGPLPRPRPQTLSPLRPWIRPLPRPGPLPRPRPRPQIRPNKIRKILKLIWIVVVLPIVCAICKGCHYCCCSTPPDLPLSSDVVVFSALSARQDHQQTDATATADGLLRSGGPSAQPGSDTPIGHTSSPPRTLV